MALHRSRYEQRATDDCVSLWLHGHTCVSTVSKLSGRNLATTIEAVIFGVPGVAISADEAHTLEAYQTAAQAALQIARLIMERGLPRGILLNVNASAGPAKGWRVTRQGKRVYRDALVVRHAVLLDRRRGAYRRSD